MRTFGIVLIVIGIAMFLFRGFSFTKEKKVVDIGPVEINKKEKESVSWPIYAGAVVTAVGAFLVVSGKKK